MSVKRWRQQGKDKAELGEQEQELRQEFKMNKIKKEFGQISEEELFKPITKRYLGTDATDRTAAAATNAGSKSRGALWHGGAIVETIISLNRFSFFEELSDRLLPPLHLEFEIVLQDDNEIIFQNDGTGRRILVQKFELWVPQLMLTSSSPFTLHN